MLETPLFPCSCADPPELHSSGRGGQGMYQRLTPGDVSEAYPIDGNKRIGLAAALVFLEINGVEINQGTKRLYELTMPVACGAADKAEIAQTLRSLASHP